MDVLVCNGLGIYCGMKTLAWLSMKPYQWQGLWNIPTYKYDATLAALNTENNFLSKAGFGLFKNVINPLSEFTVTELQKYQHCCVRMYVCLFLTASLLCPSQGEDKADSLPVHTVQLGEVWMEACFNSSALACCVRYHLYGEKYPVFFIDMKKGTLGNNGSKEWDHNKM